MEERLIDAEEKIKLRRTQDGETDAVDARDGAEDEEVEAEILFDFPEDEYDDDLVGLTPSQLKEELEKREKARKEAIEESLKLVSEGERMLAEGNFEGAASAYEQATVYDAENADALRGLWTARTHNFTQIEPLYNEEYAEAIASREDARLLVTAHLGEKLRAARKEYAAEEETLRPEVEAAQSERREGFAANKRYYVIRTCVTLFLMALFAIGTAISGDSILRTQSITPIVLTIVFGALTFAAFAVFAVYLTKLYAANRLCRENEKLSSTESGTRLAFLQERLHILALILDGNPQDSEEE